MTQTCISACIRFSFTACVCVWRNLVLVVLALTLWAAPPAFAASSTCLLATPSGMTLVYDPASATPVAVMASLSFSCTNTTNSADTLYYEVGVSSPQSSGTNWQALNGSNTLSYKFSRDSVNGPTWADSSGSRFGSATVPVNIPGKSSSTFNLNFYLSIPSAQNVAAGNYLDTLTLKLYYGPTANPVLKDSRTFGLSIGVATACMLSSPPGDVLFRYTSFQTTPALASTSFGVTCVNGTAYSMALDSNSGSLLGLDYTLSISPVGSRTGTGMSQSATINGSMAGGQAGTCSTPTCTSSQTRTLTISY